MFTDSSRLMIKTVSKRLQEAVSAAVRNPSNGACSQWQHKHENRLLPGRSAVLRGLKKVINKRHEKTCKHGFKGLLLAQSNYLALEDILQGCDYFSHRTDFHADIPNILRKTHSRVLCDELCFYLCARIPRSEVTGLARWRINIKS